MNKIYISEDTFSAFIAFIQKGLSSDMHFFVFDYQNILKERIWTFSSSVFIPNVKSDDNILKKHKVPVVISVNLNEKPPENTSVILYETISKEICVNNNFIAFVKSNDDKKAIMQWIPKESVQIFQKVGIKWIEQ
jgi:DNA polymerase IIIc chi subunit